MKAIRVEKIFLEEFSNIETVEGQRPIWFGYGDAKELDAVLVTKKDGKYPLLWYVMPKKWELSRNSASAKARFLLAHNTNLDWFNDQRFNKVYDDILFPYLEAFLRQISLSHRISFLDDGQWEQENIPNYPTSSLQESKQVDFWDVVVLDIDLIVENDYEC